MQKIQRQAEMITSSHSDEEGEDHQMLSLAGPPPFTTPVLQNDAPVWVEFCAVTVPAAGCVQPATGFWAPRGGADNLCNEQERYVDSCAFVVSDASRVQFLVVGTEETFWKFKLEQG